MRKRWKKIQRDRADLLICIPTEGLPLPCDLVYLILEMANILRTGRRGVAYSLFFDSKVKRIYYKASQKKRDEIKNKTWLSAEMKKSRW